MADDSLSTSKSQYNDVQTAYFAGLIDGEGYVAVKKKRRKKTGAIFHMPIITVGMSHEETVTAFKNYFGIGSTWKTDHHKDKGYAPMFWWSVSALQAKRVASMILPFSITKKEFVLAILAQETPKRGQPFMDDSHDYRRLISPDGIDKLMADYHESLAAAKAAGRVRLWDGWFGKKVEELGIERKILYTIVMNRRHKNSGNAP